MAPKKLLVLLCLKGLFYKYWYYYVVTTFTLAYDIGKVLFLWSLFIKPFYIWYLIKFSYLPFEVNLIAYT